MYERHFGLSDGPFATSPDPRYLFFTSSHREALAGLMYGILNRKGFVSLIGDAGTGKTSLLRRVLEAVTCNKSLIVSPNVSAAEFTKLVMANFGLDDIPSSRVDQFIKFEKFLKQSREEHKLCVLIVDEAQRLSPGVLEEIRMLTNFELPEGKLLQIVLSGQSELKGILNRPDLWQLKQRIAMRLTLRRLAGLEEISAYIRHRWVTAGGGDTTPFSEEALQLIVHYSAGVPRIVNVLCDNALLLAFGEGAQVVTPEQVRAAAAELDLGDPAGELPLNGFPSSNGIHRHVEPAPVGVSAPLHSSRPASIPPIERLPPVRARRSRFWGWFAKG